MENERRDKMFLSVAITLLFLLSIFLVCLVESTDVKTEQKVPAESDALQAPDNSAINENATVASEENATEKYEAKLFLEAKWGKGKGEVGLSNPSEQGIEDAGPNYGPESFDVADDGLLYLLDSVNERTIVYDGSGKYVKDFPIVCGGTGDIRVSPDQKNLYVFSWRCGAVYKYDRDGKILDTYKLSSEMLDGALGVGGLGFDEFGNTMLSMKIEGYGESERFFQIGKQGDEWKGNNYKGYSIDKEKYCNISWIDWQNANVDLLNRDGSVINNFKIKSPVDSGKMYIYYAGSDEQRYLYFRLDIDNDNSDKKEKEMKNIFVKYNRSGKNIAVIDTLYPLTSEEKMNYYYTNYFENRRVDKNGEIYYAFFFKNMGEIIYKYSKVN